MSGTSGTCSDLRSTKRLRGQFLTSDLAMVSSWKSRLDGVKASNEPHELTGENSRGVLYGQELEDPHLMRIHLIIVRLAMKRTNAPHVALDSQCLSYLLDGIAGISEPTDSLAEEKKALLRSWFYKPGTFILTETVISEVGRIRNLDRREFHESFVRTLFLDYPVRDLAAVQARAAEFEVHHPKPSDCRILAEAEELGLDLVLTYDHDFLKRLSTASGTTKLRKPSAYWTTLGIPKGVKPVTVPHHTNPLSGQSWWRC